MIIQPIINIAEICAQHQITQAVICPGSRNAPLTLAFARHPQIKTYVIPDERSAGFIGLGLAQSSQKPVVIVCTSGTAVANLYPAIIEAFYQQVPLLIFTADRPPEWIDQQDGQAIRQAHIYQNHILKTFEFPVSFDHIEAVWHSERMVSEAILVSSGQKQGPVHINIPIREPFYPTHEEKFQFEPDLKIITTPSIEKTPDPLWINSVIKDFEDFDKILVVVGQTTVSPGMIEVMNAIQRNLKWIFLGDITANIHGLSDPVTKHDIILKIPGEKQLEYVPELLLTFGKSVLSKSLKTFFRNQKIKEHWHIDKIPEFSDSYKSLTRHFQLDPYKFFKLIRENITIKKETQTKYFNKWIECETVAESFIENHLDWDEIGEFNVVKTLLDYLPENCQLHLTNSMPVRYANLIGVTDSFKGTIWSNRGTSGIDGCTGTCIGHAINSKDPNVLLTGDIAFFYDRNSLWHEHVPDNLRIILLNNHGGGIFRLIDGPKQLDELEEFFESNQKLNAANTARDFGLKYFKLQEMIALPDQLNMFFRKDTGPAILEVETNPNTNQQFFEEFNRRATKLWES